MYSLGLNRIGVIIYIWKDKKVKVHWSVKIRNLLGEAFCNPIVERRTKAQLKVKTPTLFILRWNGSIFQCHWTQNTNEKKTTGELDNKNGTFVMKLKQPSGGYKPEDWDDMVRQIMNMFPEEAFGE